MEDAEFFARAAVIEDIDDVMRLVAELANETPELRKVEVGAAREHLEHYLEIMDVKLTADCLRFAWIAFITVSDLAAKMATYYVNDAHYPAFMSVSTAMAMKAVESGLIDDDR